MGEWCLGGAGMHSQDGMGVSWVHRMTSLVEKCMLVLEYRALEWKSLLLGDRSAIDQSTPFMAVSECILTFLKSSSWSSEHDLSHHIGQKLVQRGILNKLHGIVERCFQGNAPTAGHRTTLEQIVEVVVHLDASQTNVESAMTAFRLFARFGTTSSRHDMLRHALPFLSQLSISSAPKVTSSALQMKSPEFHDTCLSFFWNVLASDGNSTLFGPSMMDRHERFRLAAAIVRFMVFTMEQQLQLQGQSDDDDWMAEDDASSSGSDNGTSFTIPTRLMACVQLLHDSHGQSVLFSLADALFSVDQPEDSAAQREYCELLFFVLHVSSRTPQKYGLLSSMAGPGKLVQRLWHDCVQRHWNATNASPITDRGHLDNLIAPLVVLCEIYSAFLNVAGEHEVCQQEIPLRLSEVYDTTSSGNGLITILKTSIWNWVWVRTPPTASGSSTSAIRAAMMADFPRTCGRLLMQLSENSARWNLIPRDRFYIQSAQLSQFVEEASSVVIREAADEGIEHSHKRTSRILRHVPCLIPFQDRARIFQAQLEFHRSQSAGYSTLFASPTVHARVRRVNIFEDSFEQLRQLTSNAFHDRMRVEFIDEHGMVEAGVDGGGLFKDFIEELVHDGFDPEKEFFAVTDEQELHPNPSANMTPDHLEHMTFLGRMLGAIQPGWPDLIVSDVG